jgi:hypothetical protein
MQVGRSAHRELSLNHGGGVRVLTLTCLKPICSGFRRSGSVFDRARLRLTAWLRLTKLLLRRSGLEAFTSVRTTGTASTRSTGAATAAAEAAVLRRTTAAGRSGAGRRRGAGAAAGGMHRCTGACEAGVAGATGRTAGIATGCGIAMMLATAVAMAVTRGGTMRMIVSAVPPVPATGFSVLFADQHQARECYRRNRHSSHHGRHSSVIVLDF